VCVCVCVLEKLFPETCNFRARPCNQHLPIHLHLDVTKQTTLHSSSGRNLADFLYHTSTGGGAADVSSLQCWACEASGPSFGAFTLFPSLSHLTHIPVLQLLRCHLHCHCKPPPAGQTKLHLLWQLFPKAPTAAAPSLYVLRRTTHCFLCCIQGKTNISEIARRSKSGQQNGHPHHPANLSSSQKHTKRGFVSASQRFHSRISISPSFFFLRPGGSESSRVTQKKMHLCVCVTQRGQSHRPSLLGPTERKIPAESACSILLVCNVKCDSVSDLIAR